MGQPITTNKFSKTADRLETRNTFSLLEYSVVYLDFKNSTGSFVKSFHKCLLSTYYVPGTMLDAANTIIKYIRSTYIFYHHVDLVCCFPEKLRIARAVPTSLSGPPMGILHPADH